MVQADQIDESHPLVLEISSLRAAVSRFQEEAHSASLKLQRFSLDASTTSLNVANLERENELLKAELTILRTANPQTDLSPNTNPAVQELTLALRRLSVKQTETEQALLERNTGLAHAKSEVTKSRHSVENAYALAAQTRGRELELEMKIRELETKIRELTEELKMEDLAVQEYADLVRSLEGRNGNNETASVHSNGSAATLVDGISEGKAGLQKLCKEFSAESEQLKTQVEKLKGELAASKAQLEAEVKASEADRILLANAQKELQMIKIEDKSAASMVSRYMKFSQSSTNALQQSVSALKTRHSATIDTFSSQLANLSAQLQSSQATSEKLRNTLDELGKDIMRESWGRRQEIALRLKLVVREEKLQEGLSRWIRRSLEVLDQEGHQISRSSLEKLLSDARSIYSVLDTPSASKAPPVPVPESQYSPYAAPTGSLARIIAVESSVKSLVEELQIQTVRRQELELAVASAEVIPPIPAKDTVSFLTTAPSTDRAELDSASSEAQEPVEGVDGNLAHSVTAEESVRPIVPDVVLEILPESNTTPDPQISADRLFVESTAVQLLDPSASDSIAFPSTEEEPEFPVEEATEDPHPLIEELTHVSHRYDDLQRAFRDCHLALQELRKSIATNESEDVQSSHLPHTINGISSQIFYAAVERLDNYNEDARVELEIRAADEALLAHGYQTMLSLSGTLPTSPSSSSSFSLARSFSRDSQQDSEPTASELEAQIREFARGTDLNVRRAQQNLSRKLADVQNDIAVLKRAIHDTDAFGPSPPSAPTMNGSNSNTSTGWASWIRGAPSSRPSSPAPAPTFGHLMTSPRLKHSSSFHHDLSPRRRGSVGEQPAHPLANLDLRVSMPAFNNTSLASSLSGAFSPPGIDWHGPRARTVSTMNMLGLGSARSPSSAAVASPKLQRTTSMNSSNSQVVDDLDLDSGANDDIE